MPSIYLLSVQGFVSWRWREKIAKYCKTFPTNASLNFRVWFDHVCIPSVLLSASILARVIWDRRRWKNRLQSSHGKDMQILWLCVLLILKAELFQQRNRNIFHDLNAYGKMPKKNHSLTSRFSQTRKRQRLQNKLLLIVIFLGVKRVISEGMV